jgi:hypothetical protein
MVKGLDQKQASSSAITQHQEYARTGKPYDENETFGVESIRDHDRPMGPEPEINRSRKMHHDSKRAVPGPNKSYHAEPKHHDGDWNEY